MLNRSSWMILLVVCVWLTMSLAVPINKDKKLALKGKLFYGLGTFYEVGSGSCGEYDTDEDMVVAVNQEQMDNGPNPNMNPLCDKIVYIQGSVGSTSAKVVDTCPACKSGALDMSPTVFQKVCGTLSAGVCKINWSYV